MATVNKLMLDLAAFEHDLKTGMQGDAMTQQAVRTGYMAAMVAAQQRILELCIKGIIPEGRGGKISEAVTEAVRESCKRVVP
jgi:hypothetical protein